LPTGRRTKLLGQARENRLASTGAEARLYNLLKSANAGRVRRQVDIGNLIVDLALPERILVIEVDGECHVGKSEKDARRDAWLRGVGFRVLRVANEQVLEDRHSVVEQVLEFPASAENQTFFNIGLRVARTMTDMTHTPQPPSP